MAVMEFEATGRGTATAIDSVMYVVETTERRRATLIHAEPGEALKRAGSDEALERPLTDAELLEIVHEHTRPIDQRRFVD